MRTEFLCISVLIVASGPRSKLACCKSALNPGSLFCSSNFLIQYLKNNDQLILQEFRQI